MDVDEVLAYTRLRVDRPYSHVEPGIPHYASFPDEQRRVVFGFKPGNGTLGSGFLVHEYRHVGQWGTRRSAATSSREVARWTRCPSRRWCCRSSCSTFVNKSVPTLGSLRTTARLRARGRVRADPRSGVRGFVDGLGTRWPDAAAMDNRDAQGNSRAPGWDVSALRVLFEQRGCVAIGHDVTSTDPAALVDRGHVEAETYVLARDRWQIELHGES